MASLGKALTLVRGLGHLSALETRLAPILLFSDLLEIENVMSEIKTALPEIKTALPEIKTALPEIKTSLPEIKTALLEIKIVSEYES